ncbi:hypothetical protein TRICI_004223 [Trichomonascus ciferrii]|uniref:Xylanolytic transcriptional activator regulatory domain-containing protein n=1 Tax=Trichomonascus ciferrii TaxID=44093 RepID=A0A642V7U1_9ASCO|nr:hypothetical protein TRICI_004223 [Trichomonascus ciferrii]
MGNERGKILKSYSKKDEIDKRLAFRPLTPGDDFDLDFCLGLMDEYEESIFPVCPVVTKKEIVSCLSKLANGAKVNGKDGGLVYASCAMTFSHTRARFVQLGEKNYDAVVRQLLDRALAVRGCINTRESLNVSNIMTSAFLSSCYVSLDEVDLAWFYLKEAISIAAILGLGQTRNETPRNLRLYWMLFIHERSMSVKFQRGIQLRAIDKYPDDEDPDIPEGIRVGFMQLVKLFELIDEDVINSSRDQSVVIDWQTLELKQGCIKQLEADVQQLSLTSMQQADLLITQQWLKIVFWKLAISRYQLALETEDSCMSLLYPMEVSRALNNVITTVSMRDIAVHGCGIIRKLVELTVSISDVIISIPENQLHEPTNQIDSFVSITEFLCTQPTVTPYQKELLREKLENIKTKFLP